MELAGLALPRMAKRVIGKVSPTPMFFFETE